MAVFVWRFTTSSFTLWFGFMFFHLQYIRMYVLLYIDYGAAKRYRHDTLIYYANDNHKVMSEGCFYSVSTIQSHRGQ